MAIDNTLYDSLEDTYKKIKEYFDTTQLRREHSSMIVKHEELAELLETFDIEALEEQSKDINELHAQLDGITEICQNLLQDLNDVSKVVDGLDDIFLKIVVIKKDLGIK